MLISYQRKQREVAAWPEWWPAGTRVATIAGRVPLQAVAWLSCLDHDWTWIPLDPSSPEAPKRLVAARAHVAVCTSRTRSLVPEDWPGHVVVVDDWGDGGKPAQVTAWPKPREGREPNAVLGEAAASAGVLPSMPGSSQGAAVLLHSSGTTGRPRPVVLTAAMLDVHARSAAKRVGHDESSVWLAVLAFHHVAGVALLHRLVRFGGRLVLAELEDEGAWEGVTHASLVPVQLERLILGKRMKVHERLRCLLVGGDAVGEEVVQGALKALWPVFCTYGLTEACSQVATATPQERQAHPGTVGAPLDGVTVTIEKGEIVVSGPTVAGGRVATGDSGYVSDGRLFVTGRLDDRITTGGAKVDPTKVEEVFRAHPRVKDVCVVGLPDATWGQVVAVALVVEGAATWGAFEEHCRHRLDSHEVPRRWKVVAQLPRTSNGKVRRGEVRESAGWKPTKS